MALTDKKRRFADALLSGASNRDAAIAAGYSEKTASQAGSKLAKDPDVIAAIGRHLRERQAAATEVKPGRKVKGPPPDDGVVGELDLGNFDDPMDFLKAVMNEQAAEPKLRVDAAKALLPYKHGKVADQGKKEQKAAAADQVSKGRFGARPPPKLVVNNKG
ncbi:terminase small subunit [Pseudomonas putida]|uniref:terminase small subunit n=1 Tax=Pseudomonas putida TaxID=303 RepID=UPI0039E141AF